VFGPGYSKKVSDFAAVSERLNKDLTQVAFRPETVPKTPFEQATGIPLEQLISRFFNPVSGPTYAATSIFSKLWANKASDATEKKLKELLLNPTDFIRVANAVAPRAENVRAEQIKTLLDVGKKYGINWVQDAVSDARAGALRGARAGGQEPVQMPQPEMITEDVEE
jgi:hypothetical protein